jgi:Ankyrin repeats (3 copies)
MARRIKSKLMQGFLVEARAAWKRGDYKLAIDRAARVFLAEGRDVFTETDRDLFTATLAQLLPPVGHASWDAYFEHEAANPTPVDNRTDQEIVDQIARDRGRTSLHDASEKGQLAQVKKLLAGGADANAIFENGSLRWTPVCAAVFGDHLDVVRMLLDTGAKLDHGTPAIFGVQSVAVAELLVDRGASLDAVDPLGRTVFARVIDTKGDVALAKWLAARSPRPMPAQAAVIERTMVQTSPELRNIARAFLDRPR